MMPPLSPAQTEAVLSALSAQALAARGGKRAVAEALAA